MAVSYQRERFDDVCDEARPLMQRHYAEADHFGTAVGQADEAMYRGAEVSGLLRVFTVREDSRLVGYASFFVRTSPHTHGDPKPHALHDTMFLVPEKRNGFTGIRFIEFCERELQAEGVTLVYQHVTVKHDHRVLLERRNYELVEYVYAKRLA